MDKIQKYAEEISKMGLVFAGYDGKKHITYFDKNNYKYFRNISDIRRNINSNPFDTRNPYTIENIHTYIKNQHISCELISKEYLGAFGLLEFKCLCGEPFLTTFSDFRKGKHTCNHCSWSHINQENREEYIPSKKTINDVFNKKGFSIIDGEYQNRFSKFTAINYNGYKIYTSYRNIRSCNPYFFSANNPYTIENIKNFIRINYNDEYSIISDVYENNEKHLQFKHNLCGLIFPCSWNNFKSGCGCPACSRLQTESTHASVLKQVFLHEFSDTIVEEKSCINPNTNRILPTDIVNHRLKIAIEIQSAYHDVESKKNTDKIKKDFWINKGYSFYDPDIRDYSVLEMIQLFFPKILKLPDYINYNFSYKLDILKCQDLLNDKIPLDEITRILKCSKSSIFNAIQDKRCYLPENYYNNMFYCFNEKMELINEFNSVLSASNETGLSRFKINRSLKNHGLIVDGLIFIYKNDFDNNNYSVNKVDDIYVKSVDMFDYETNDYICTAENVLDLSKIYNINSRSIYRTLRNQNDKKYMLCDYQHNGKKHKVYFRLRDVA